MQKFIKDLGKILLFYFLITCVWIAAFEHEIIGVIIAYGVVGFIIFFLLLGGIVSAIESYEHYKNRFKQWKIDRLYYKNKART